MKCHPWALVFTLAAAFLCNACDGLFGSACENDAPMLRISAEVEIDVFEASRTNASQDSMGQGLTTACSYHSVLPWGNVSYEDAVNACLAANKRLCTHDEWKAACGTAPSAGTCNEGAIESLPSGEKTGCRTSLGAYDMIGNLREWVEGGILVGGSYSNQNSDCDTVLQVGDPFTYRPTLSDGFRCCRNIEI